MSGALEGKTIIVTGARSEAHRLPVPDGPFRRSEGNRRGGDVASVRRILVCERKHTDRGCRLHGVLRQDNRTKRVMTPDT